MSEQPGAADEIMNGVYRALCKHGYAALTMQDIADECSKSKSLLHYHYDTKEDLLVAFLSRVISDFERRMSRGADAPPVERLVAFVGWFVFEPAETDRESFHIGLLEMRSQGPFNDRIREQLLRSDRLLRETAADVLSDGIDAGVFREVDVDETAALLVATLDGARTRQITLGTGLGGAAAEGTTGAGLDGTEVDFAYTRTVAEATLRRIVEPLLAEGVTLPSLDDTLERLTARTGENPADGPDPESEGRE
ncbi:TetR/AcrR family transcriptional regulator [Halorubrum halodurans]|uniref:TetR family transcriptional regulator n=1 Tax=Halorubrum halodurans TaxID=1383851 RepID=A0A256IFV9_9EURY|nr:TetR/AcrR family transcriptional regulator [Halorubrum halodurans]OYR55363.1 TetR family transcriptional regulator [Halorubrum halodurans]